MSRRSVGSRRTRRTRRSTAVSLVGSKWKNPLPNTGLYRLVYNDSAFSVSLNLANSYVGTAYFRGNGPYDPDASGVGVQPYGFDQLLSATSPFQRYQVYASKITIYLYTQPSYTTPINVRVAIVPSDTTTAGSPDMNDILMYPGCKSIVLRSNDQGRWKLSNYSTTRRVLGWNAPGGESEASAAYNTTPSNQWFWRCFFDATNIATNSFIGFDVKIKYYCRLFKETYLDES